MTPRLLIVEDDSAVQAMLLEAVRSEGYDAQATASAEAALELLSSEAIDIVITDIKLPGMSGLDILPNVQQVRPGAITIVMTGYATVDAAVEAMKRGAADFLTKPVRLDALSVAIQGATKRLEQERVKATWSFKRTSDIVARSPAMKKLLEQVNAIAGFNTTVLITGETGTGKELIARGVHNQSPRRVRPLIALNCAAVPEQLLEDELFGHVRGAFTGAQTTREGRFEQADNSTLFLDEIGDMSLPLQSKLLRVLQEREFEKLGSSRTIKVDVRIIAATSADLEARIADGSFRPDLFYRLNVVHLRLPPLRERREDIPPLAEQLLARFCATAGLPLKKISDEAWTPLLSYRWPGNVRQLQNAMERAAALSGASQVIYTNDLPEEVRHGAPAGVTPVLQFAREPETTVDSAPPATMGRRVAATDSSAEAIIPDEGLSFDAVVTKVERELLLNSLQKAGGNKMRAAKLLNMKRTTFVEKLKRLDITADDDIAGREDTDNPLRSEYAQKA